MHVLIAIPALNEAATIGDLVGRLPRKLEGVAAVDVLVVDDGSTDGTGDVAREAGAQVVRHSHNRGLGAAFQSSVGAALRGRYNVMITIDGDGQFDPREIPAVAEPVIAGRADFVSGNRFHEGAERPENMPPIKYAGNAMMSWLIGKVAQRSFDDVSCGFRAYSNEALLWLNTRGRFTYTQEVFLDLASKDLRIELVPISVIYHAERKSRVAGSILRYAFNTSLINIKTFRDHQTAPILLDSWRYALPYWGGSSGGEFGGSSGGEFGGGVPGARTLDLGGEIGDSSRTRAKPA